MLQDETLKPKKVQRGREVIFWNEQMDLLGIKAQHFVADWAYFHHNILLLSQIQQQWMLKKRKPVPNAPGVKK